MQKARVRLGLSAYSQPPAVPAMPAGLVELMEGLSREVLKHNPTDVHQFCADHMKRLLDVRDAREGKPAAKPLPLEKKIAKAQEKVRQRAEQRRKKYDELIKQVLLENNQVEGKEENETDKSTATLENGAIVLQHVVNAVSGPNSEDNVVSTGDSAEIREEEIIIPPIKENEPDKINEITNMVLKTDNADNSAIDKEEEAVDIKVVESETKEVSAITEQASSEDRLPKISTSCEDNDVIAESNENSPIFEEQIAEKKVSVLQDSGKVNEDTSSEHHIEGTIEVVVIEQQESETESKAAIQDENNDDKNKIHSDNTQDNKNDQNKLVVEDDEVEAMSEPVSVDPENDSTSTNNEKFYPESKDNAPTIGTVENVIESIPDLKSSKDLSKDNEEMFDVKSSEREALDKQHKEMYDDKQSVVITTEETSKEAQSNDDFDMVKPEILEIGDVLEPPATGKADDEIIQLEKTPEVLDEIQLKENEVILTSSASNGDDETNTVTENNSTDNGEEANDAHSPQHDEGTKSIKTEVSTDRLDIDTNSLAKSNSINDIITEESNDSNSESITTNGVSDSQNKSPRSASTMDLETAAVTIQKVFRNFLFKSRASTLDDVSIDDGSVEAAYPPDDNLSDQCGNVLHAEEQYHAPIIKERRTLGITRMDTVLQTVNEEKSLSLSTDDSSLSSAATIIQARVRGFLVRNKLHSNKTSSLVNSDWHPSFDVDNEQQKNKTVLNIHILPEGGHYMSRDESMAMSLDLPYDNSPTSSTNLHPFSYDTAERRKQLKREDAIQSISPPSTNSGKLSEDIDSVKELSVHDTASTPSAAVVADDMTNDDDRTNSDTPKEIVLTSGDTTPTKSVTGDTVIENLEAKESPKPEDSHRSVAELTSDEADVVMAVSPRGLRHSGEFHDAPLPLPTSVARADSTVAREFKTVLSYLLIWNSSS